MKKKQEDKMQNLLDAGYQELCAVRAAGPEENCLGGAEPISTQRVRGEGDLQISIVNCQLNGNGAIPERQESRELSSAAVWDLGFRI